MRKIILAIGAAFMLLSSAALAQVSGPPGETANSPPPVMRQSEPPTGIPRNLEPLPLPSSSAGLNKTASDGVSTTTVPAVPCSTSARETDGTTTCVGIPGPIDRSRTTGSGRY